MTPLDTEPHQDRLLARADRAADAAEAVVRDVWGDLLAILEKGGPWHAVHAAAARALRRLPHAGRAVTAELVGTARASARWTADRLARALTAVERRRLLGGQLLEKEETLAGDSLLLAVLLPSLEDAQIHEVLHAAGWGERIQALSALADPEVLAGRMATLLAQGQSVAEVARAIRPQVQNVQTVARRVARTAGLWIAHEAELACYDRLGPLIKGYRVNAVLDRATRPEHRARDGQEFYRSPGSGQTGFEEMPRPPREADGSWAFNCRCWLEPILG